MFKLVNLPVTSRFSHNLDTLQSANFIKLYFAININIDQCEKKNTFASSTADDQNQLAPSQRSTEQAKTHLVFLS